VVDPDAEEIRRWIEPYTSDSMKEQYLKYLEEYCQFFGKTPKELLEIKRTQTEATAEKMLDDFVIMWKKSITYEGRAEEIPDSVKTMAVRAVRSFYSANYLDLAKKAGSGAEYVRKKAPVAPTQDELREMCVGMNLMNIALINVLSSGGFREDTLRKLNWGHVLEFESWDGHTPVYIRVTDRELKGKGRGKYKNLEQHAFLAPHATKALLDYKKWRESRGEAIKSESPLFSLVRGMPKQISARELRAIFERACERHLFKFSPHDLRRFTQTQLEAARVQPNWIRKMLGKTVKGEEDPYSRPKIEQLRAAYQQAVSYLTLAPPSEAVSDRAALRAIMTVAQSYGISKDRIKEIEDLFSAGRMTIEQVQDRIAEMMRKNNKGGENNKKTIVIDEEDLENHLNHGWIFVGCTPSGRCIIKRTCE